MLSWSIRLAGVVAAALLAYGWGDFATDPGPVAFVLLAALTVVLVAALARLYRPGGPAAFAFDDEPVARRAPGEPVPAAGPAGAAPPRRRAPTASGRAAAVPAPAPPRSRPAPAAPPAPPPRSRPAPGGSLWSSDRPAAPAEPVPLNTAGVAELAPLPGLGRVWAERIVADRDARGPFASLEDLARVEGFNPAKLAALRGRLRLEA